MPALLRDEREIVTVRQHPIVIFDLPHKYVLVAFLAAIVVAYFVPNPVAWLLAIVVVLRLVWRWYNWREERIVLTNKRIIRMSGVPETTELEAFLRVDRISGVVLVQSVVGKICNYGTLHLEAPGDHPTLRRLEKVGHVTTFYRALRTACFGQDQLGGRDPDEPDTSRYGRDSRGRQSSSAEVDYVTEPLPPAPPPRVRGWRHTP